MAQRRTSLNQPDRNVERGSTKRKPRMASIAELEAKAQLRIAEALADIPPPRRKEPEDIETVMEELRAAGPADRHVICENLTNNPAIGKNPKLQKRLHAIRDSLTKTLHQKTELIEDALPHNAHYVRLSPSTSTRSMSEDIRQIERENQELV